jgi:hypothetical protein
MGLRAVWSRLTNTFGAVAVIGLRTPRERSNDRRKKNCELNL